MSIENTPEQLEAASFARQLLLLSVVMNLLALIAVVLADLDLVPGMLFAVGVLGGCAGISFIRKSMGFSMFVNVVLWLITLAPLLNLALLIPLYRSAESTLRNLKDSALREEALTRTRERQTTTTMPALTDAILQAAAANTTSADAVHSETIEFVSVTPPDQSV